MKILVLGDLHGKIPKLKIKKTDFDCIVQIGDICGHPMMEKLWKSFFKFLKKNPETKFIDYIKQTYGWKKYYKIEEESLVFGSRVMDFLNSLGKPVFFVPGNYDCSYGKSRINKENSEKLMEAVLRESFTYSV